MVRAGHIGLRIVTIGGTLVNTVMNSWVPRNAGNFLASLQTSNSLERKKEKKERRKERKSATMI
jgi:hypothetical protein